MIAMWFTAGLFTQLLLLILIAPDRDTRRWLRRYAVITAVSGLATGVLSAAASVVFA